MGISSPAVVVVSQQSSVGFAWAIACFILTKLGGNFVSRAAVVSQLSSVVLLGRSCCIFDETLWKFRHQRRLAHTPAVVSRQSCFIFDENQWGLRHQIRGPVGESEDLEHARLQPGTVPPPLLPLGLHIFLMPTASLCRSTTICRFEE